MRIALQTHGCRLNQSESDAMERSLVDGGHEIVDDPSSAEVFVLNTCTITHGADADARQTLRRVHREHPHARIWVTGCYAQHAAETLRALPGVERVFGNLEKDAVTSYASGPKASELVSVTSLRPRKGGTRPSPWRMPPALAPRRSRAYLKIQDGCNYRCSFCIVPQIRGRSRSLSVDTLERQFAELLAAGHHEVVLTGVHLGTYGWDFGDRQGLETLLRRLVARIERHERPARVRLGSLDPHELRPGLIELIAEHPDAICRHLHLPVQSGSASILRRMRRAHSAEDLRELIPRVRAAIPGVALGSDVIVGFPGETETDFAASCELFGEHGLDYAHVFTYSEREGTDAVGFEDRVDEGIKRRRNARLREIALGRWQAFSAAQVGNELEVVVERSRHRSGRLVGLADNYSRIFFEGPDELLAGRARVAVRGHRRGALEGSWTPSATPL